MTVPGRTVEFVRQALSGCVPTAYAAYSITTRTRHNGDIGLNLTELAARRYRVVQTRCISQRCGAATAARCSRTRRALNAADGARRPPRAALRSSPSRRSLRRPRWHTATALPRARIGQGTDRPTRHRAASARPNRRGIQPRSYARGEQPTTPLPSWRINRISGRFAPPHIAARRRDGHPDPPLGDAD